MSKHSPRVQIAAIWYQDESTPVHGPKTPTGKGLVLCGRRHCDIIGQYLALTGKPTRGNTVQGFVLDIGVFVDRAQAAEIAFLAGQIEEMKDELFSEDIY